jgi:hypothetical protein
MNTIFVARQEDGLPLAASIESAPHESSEDATSNPTRKLIKPLLRQLAAANEGDRTRLPAAMSLKSQLDACVVQ